MSRTVRRLMARSLDWRLPEVIPFQFIVHRLDVLLWGAIAHIRSRDAASSITPVIAAAAMGKH
jgi:hypothetical protein